MEFEENMDESARLPGGRLCAPVSGGEYLDPV